MPRLFHHTRLPAATIIIPALDSFAAGKGVRSFYSTVSVTLALQTAPKVISCFLGALESFNDSVPGVVIKTAPSGDRTA